MVTLQMKREEEAVRRWLEGIGLPETVVGYRLRFDLDATGEASVYISFILTSALDTKTFAAETLQVFNQVWDTFSESGLELNPYLHFFREGEVEDIREENDE